MIDWITHKAELLTRAIFSLPPWDGVIVTVVAILFTLWIFYCFLSRTPDEINICMLPYLRRGLHLVEEDEPLPYWAPSWGVHRAPDRILIGPVSEEHQFLLVYYWEIAGEQEDFEECALIYSKDHANMIRITKKDARISIYVGNHKCEYVEVLEVLDSIKEAA